MNAKELKEIRAFLSYSQDELAVKLHCSARQIQRYERGELEMPTLRRDRLIKIYKNKKRGQQNAN